MATTTAKVTVDTSQATQALANLQSSLKNTTSSFDQLRNAVAGIAVAGYIKSLYSMANAISDVATASGVSVQALVGFRTAVAANGGAAADAVDSMGKFAIAMDNFASGSKEAQNAVASLGINLEDFSQLSPEEKLGAVVSGLGKLENQAKATSIGVQLFGKSFKAVDFKGVAADIGAMTAGAKDSAIGISTAGQASQNFSNAITTFQYKLLTALTPLSELAVSITENTKAVGAFIDAAIRIGAVILAFTLVGRAAWVLRLAFTAIAEGWAAITTGAALAVNIFRNFSLLIANFKLFSTFGGVLSALGYIFSGLGTAIMTALPGLVAFGVAIYEGYGFLKEYIVALGEWLSIVKKTVPVNEDAAKAEEKKKREKQELVKALGAESIALKKVISDYQLALEQSNKKFGGETANIGKSAQVKQEYDEKLAAEVAYQKEMEKLKNELAQKQAKAATSPDDAAMIPEINAAMSALTAQYNTQLAVIQKMVDARAKAEAGNQLRLFGIQSQIALESQITALHEESANVSLPLLEQQYRKITAAAKETATQAIAAEEARRGSPLSTAEQDAYYAAAKTGIEGVKKAQRELNEETNKWQKHLFDVKEEISLQNNLNKLKDDLATITMPELEKKYYDIGAAAKASAKAAIDAEEARRGTPLNKADIEAYYAAAESGAKKLAAATKVADAESRKFGTGWQKTMKQYIEDAGNGAKLAADLFTKATKGMEDAIVGFAKTGKFEWKGFVESMLEELLRSQIKTLFADLMGGMSNGLNGLLGIFSGGATAGGASGGAGGQGGGGIMESLSSIFGGGADQGQKVFVTNWPGGGGNGSGGGGDVLGDFISQLGGGGGKGGQQSGGGMWDSIKEVGSSIWDGLSSVGSTISDLFGGFFADGGSLSAGKFGIVGERGPELVAGPATVFNAADMAGGGGNSGTTNVYYTINATDAPSFKAMIAADPSFIYAVSRQGAKGMPAY